MLGVLFASLAKLAEGQKSWQDAFASHLEARMGIFLPPVTARLLTDLFFRDSSSRQPPPDPEEPAHQLFITINLAEAITLLPDSEQTLALERLSLFSWASPWLARASSFLEGNQDRDLLKFSCLPPEPACIPVRGARRGELLALRTGENWFVRHTWHVEDDTRFCGAPWPPFHTLWLKPTDTIQMEDQEWDAPSLAFMQTHQQRTSATYYFHQEGSSLLLNTDSTDAVAFVEQHLGCIVHPSPTTPLAVNDGPRTGPTPLLPLDRLQVGGLELSGLQLMRQLGSSTTSAPPWHLTLDEVTFRFSDGTRGLDKVSLRLQSGDLVAVMGPSGCGKSTLLSLLTGELRSQEGSFTIDHDEGHVPVFALVPQDDVLFAELTVQENLSAATVLRGSSAPHERDSRARIALAAVSLLGKENLRVGSVVDKVLSGGERKRLNIAMELTGTPDALLLDEPTSGLSSADADSVMAVLRNHANAGMLVVAVLHQPSAEIFDRFDKVVVLDVGGRLAYFGSPAKARHYFDISVPGEPARPWGPDQILGRLIGRRTTLDGNRARRVFDPTFWQIRYLALRHLHEPPLVVVDKEKDLAPSSSIEARKPAGLKDIMLTVLHRELLRRWREWRGTLVSLGIAALLSLIVGVVCRTHGPGETSYTFKDNPNLSAFCFLAVILVQFLALSSSVQELVKDRAHRLRERLLRVPGWCWLAAKIPGLLLLVGLQSAIVVICGCSVLEVNYAQFGLWFTLALAGGCSAAMGLLVSGLPRISERVALAAVPLLLVPQMVLCGAKPFEFQNLGHLHWPADNTTKPFQGQKPQAPWITGIMPSRWAYQAVLCGLRDDSLIAPVADLKPLLKTYNHATRLVDQWRAEPAAFLTALASKTGRDLTESEVRECLLLVIRSGARTQAEVAETFGDLLPDAVYATADLEPFRNEILLDYASQQFPAPTADEEGPVTEARWMLVFNGLILALGAAAVMTISPRSIINLTARLRRWFHSSR